MREELEKEAEEYSNNWKINKKANLNFAELVELRAVIYKAYIDSAEPREKRIAELEEKISILLSCKNCPENKKAEEIIKGLLSFVDSLGNYSGGIFARAEQFLNSEVKN